MGKEGVAEAGWRKNCKKDQKAVAGSGSCTNLFVRQRKAAADKTERFTKVSSSEWRQNGSLREQV
jgi:hypothetical protein